MIRRHEFCLKCGGEVFDKENQPETKSKWDRWLHCSSCGKDSKISETITLFEEIHEDGECKGLIKMRYLQFPNKRSDEYGKG